MKKDALARLRLDVVTMAERSGHVGPALSCLDLIYALYDGVLNVRPDAPGDPGRDRFILSKGHGCMALYAVLAQRGFFPRETLAAYCTAEACLGEHPMPGKIPGVELATGSLGHGLAYAAGQARGLALRGLSARVFALLGDGECDEGSVWEAAAAATAQNLSNLTAVVDANGWQACGRCGCVTPGFDLAAAFAGFGWETRELTDLSQAALIAAFGAAPAGRRPRAFICRTVKGAGVPFMEDDLEWHYRPVRGRDRDRARACLGECPGDA